MWHIDKFILKPKEEFECYSIKDISVVYYNNNYHLFYTASGSCCNKQEYTIGYLATEKLETADDKKRNQLTNLKPQNNTYYCAPQVFYYEKNKLWYLVYQIKSDVGCYEAVYSTNKEIENPNGWSEPKALLSRSDDNKNTNKWIDFWVIGDKKHMYLFYASADKLAFRKTSFESFPRNWSQEKQIEIKGAFEAPHIYYCLKNSTYFLSFEGKNGSAGRYFVLAQNKNLDSDNWEIIDGKWFCNENLSDNKWADMPSHGEIIRASNNEQMQINDINKADYLIQGTLNKDYEAEYTKIPWVILLAKN